jgi:hypothetical protein
MNKMKLTGFVALIFNGFLNFKVYTELLGFSFGIGIVLCEIITFMIIPTCYTTFKSHNFIKKIQVWLIVTITSLLSIVGVCVSLMNESTINSVHFVMVLIASIMIQVIIVISRLYVSEKGGITND